jgi:hypothetical protein
MYLCILEEEYFGEFNNGLEKFTAGSILVLLLTI